MERPAHRTSKTKGQNPARKASGGAHPKRPIRVVPDANVLFGDPFLHGVSPQTIIAAAKFTDIKLAIADITCDELRNIVRERINKIVDELKEVTRNAGSVELKTGVDTWSLGYKSKQSMDAWEKRLASLRETLPVLPYPLIHAKELARYSIDQRRPFLEGDKGLRDYLLWSSVSAAAQKDDCIYILVSNDHGFYDGKSDTLHPDLDAALASMGLSSRVVVRKSFAGVVDEFVKPMLKPEENVEVAIKSGKIRDFTKQDDSVDIVLNEYVLGIEVPDHWITRGDYYAGEFDVVENATMMDLTSTLELDGKVLVTSEWEADVTISLSFPGYEEDSETVIVSFTVESLVNPSTLEVESHEVSDYSLSAFYDEKTGERIPY